MERFSRLLDTLSLTPQRNAKIALLVEYFRDAPDPERGLGLAAITRDLDLKSAKPGMIRELATTRVDESLYALSYDYVGDLAETTALIWPARPGANEPPELPDIVERLQSASRKEAPALIETWLDSLDATGRWALLKLVTGGMRIGVSSRLAKTALAEFGQVNINEIEELWHGLTPPYEDLFAWLENRSDKPISAALAPFRPVMLAHPVGDTDLSRLDPDDFAAEWKWDGIRVQWVREGDECRVYSRTGDDISSAFPDLMESLPDNVALDGELLVRSPEGGVAPFSDLQKRLNRKTVSKALLKQYPAFVRAYDLLHLDDKNWRDEPLHLRRTALETFVNKHVSDRLDISTLIRVESFEQLDGLRRDPPDPLAEGVMLKRWDSPYVPGRPKGPWFKWKRDPFLVDAVMMYAQRGHGKRSSFYSDFTFGVWRTGDHGHEELVPVGKAYFGFTDKELKQLDRFVRDNTTERFGPVRAVKADRDEGLVLEIAFEGLQESTRHKSGIAMRFPRIHRIRWDKPTRDADRIENLETLLQTRLEQAKRG